MLKAIEILIERLTEIMAKSLDRFKTWLADKRQFLFSWYTKDSQETQEPEQSLLELPSGLRKKLIDAVENLHSHPADKQAIAKNLDEAFDRWRANPNNANNSIVVLSSPIIAVSRILTETLEEWAQQKQIPIKFLPLTERPGNIKTIKRTLKDYLEQQHSDNDSQTQLEVAVISNLGWCFLRSVKGLEAIEYLKSLLCDGSKNRFWIIGGGQVGWGYLDSVCKIESYCGEVLVLPAIEPIELQEWFEPIVDKLGITFDEPGSDRQILDSDKDDKTNYFAHLSDISQGISTVAVQGFLTSIRYREIDEGRDEANQITLGQKRLVAQIPELPELPDLESADQYLLYSLLLHGDLTISALAESLGDHPDVVQAKVQVLRRQGILEEDKVLKINSIYYPKLKQSLANNNFVVNGE